MANIEVSPNLSNENNIFKVVSNQNAPNLSKGWIENALSYLSPDRYEDLCNIDIKKERKQIANLVATLANNPNISEISQNGIIIKQLGLSPEKRDEIQRLAIHAVGNNIQKMIREQINLEQIALNAAEEIQESNARINPINEDWLSNFQENAKGVSNEDTQKMWGRILAGESKQSGSYSLRALNILKTMTQEEARNFECFCKYSLDKHLVISSFLHEKGIIKPNDLMNLEDIGLIKILHNGEISKPASKGFVIESSDMRYFLSIAFDKATPLVFRGELSTFTRAGKELLAVVDNKMPECIDYFKYIKTRIFSNVKFEAIYHPGVKDGEWIKSEIAKTIKL